QKNDPKKPSAQLHRRGTEGFWDPDEAEAEDDRNSIEIKFNVPFEIGVRITEEEYQEYRQGLEKMLGDTLGVSAQGTACQLIIAELLQTNQPHENTKPTHTSQTTNPTSQTTSVI
ncbi:hypothetical protein Q9233_007040, partial [Columba guinea]